MGDPAKADDFFLPDAEASNDARFVPPVRQGNKVEPLIDGIAFFTSVEEAIATAKESVYCAIWNIYANTPLVSKKVKTSLGVADWQGMLTAVAKRKKVKVRLLTSDFDPVLAIDNHQRAWKAYNKFIDTASKAGLTHDYFQTFPSLHPASFVPDFLVKFVAGRELRSTVNKLNKAGLKGLENSPGIWRLVTLKGRQLKAVDKPSFVILPGSHHQKLLIIDNTIGYVGGINISDFYQNPPEHPGNRRAHDIFCRVEGPVVQDIERVFVSRWNAEMPAFNAFVNAANSIKLGNFTIRTPLAISQLSLSRAALGKQGNALAQAHRTASSGIAGTFPNLTVNLVRDDVARTYEKTISLANEYVYIENQYVRAARFADAIIKRFSQNSKLQVIIVVPVVPEELEEGKGDPISQHGLALQHETLTRIRKALGKSLGLYSLVQNKKAPADRKSQNLSSFGSLRIYPHSKVLIVDDLFASIGSANVNPRGFEFDSELDLGWHEASSVKAFREQLWKEHLGSPNGSLFATWKAKDFVKEWDVIAAKNALVKPGLRQGFVVPHDPDTAKGNKQSFPDFLAGLGVTGREESDTALA